MGINKKLSNVIGAPFLQYVLDQFYLRAGHNSTEDRTLQEVMFLANKTAWVRLLSSVNVIGRKLEKIDPKDAKTLVPYDITMKEVYNSLGVGTFDAEDSLAKNWVLEAGTSTYTSVTVKDKGGKDIQVTAPTLRYGISTSNQATGVNSTAGAYGLGGTTELGFVPMPGLTSITIETLGRLGSLRKADVNFRVNNLNQLNVIEALYFRLGYSMLLEWGHTQYYTNPKAQEPSTFKTSEIFGIGDPFNVNLRKEQIIQSINKKQTDTDGNYGGMYGIVTGFNWSATQDGGYDCTLKLIGHGAIMDSVKTNQSYTLPPGAIEEYIKYEDALAAAVARALKLAEINNSRVDGSGTSSITIYPEATTLDDLYVKIRDLIKAPSYTLTDFVNEYGYPIPAKSTFDFTVANAFGLTKKLGFASTGKKDFVIATADFPGEPNATIKANLVASYGNVYISQNNKLIHIKPGSTNISATLNVQELTDQIQYWVVPDYVRGSTSKYAYVQQQGDNFATIPGTRVPNINSSLDVLVLTAGALEPGGGYRDVVREGMSAKTLQINAKTGWVGNNITDSAIPFTVPVSSSYGFVGNYFFSASYTNPDTTFNLPPYEIMLALNDTVTANGGTLPITSISISGGANDTSPNYSGTLFKQSIKLKGYFSIKVPNVQAKANSYADRTRLKTLYNANPGLYTGYQENTRDLGNGYVVISDTLTIKELVVNFAIETNDFAPFSHWSINGVDLTVAPTKSSAVSGSGGGGIQKADTDQKEAPEGFASALQAMLTIVQSYSQYKALNERGAVPVDIAEITQNFYVDGSLSGVIDPVKVKAKGGNINGVATAMNPGEFNLLNYALKGFNATLMRDPLVYSEIPDVDFLKLCIAYVIKYRSGGLEGEVAAVRAPTYISLGYLLAFLNNMCLIYDSNNSRSLTAQAQKGSKKHPLIYIDFNPGTNFCLTTPQQFCVDPTICMIPADLTNIEYAEIFDLTMPQLSQLSPKLYDVANKNPVSQAINAFHRYKADKDLKDSGYRGNLMNILLNTQYLLDLVKQLSRNDPEHSANLKPFLDQILMDVSKSIGGINSFRVSYIDNSNVIQIVDDQWVPSPENDLTSTTSTTPLPVGSVIPTAEAPGQLTLVGTRSLTREFRFNTLISSRLASKIAISAQAETGSVNSKDHSPYSHLNTFYEDRYSKAKEDTTKVNLGVKTKKNDKGKSSDILAAELFNGHIQSLYFSTTDYVPKKIEAAKNYYLDKLNRLKAKNPLTSASPYVSLELEMTIDGISGIVMGNAFTVPNDRLPYTYQGENGTTKVAFIVTGLTHTIQNNEWLTRIKGQMIKLKKPVAINTASNQILSGQAAFPKVVTAANTSQAAGRPYQGENPPGPDQYSGAKQVPLGESVNSSNLTTYLPGAKLIKGTSNIKLSNVGTLGALAPLTEGDIIDETYLNRFLFTKFNGRPDRFVIHHTNSMYTDKTNGSGITNVTDPAQESRLSGAQNQMRIFYGRGYPAQYIIDRKGVIHRFIPDGMQSYHAGNFNGRALGVEIIAQDNSKVTDDQARAAIRLAHYLGFSALEVIGHGEVDGADRGLDEGKKVYDYIRKYLTPPS